MSEEKHMSDQAETAHFMRESADQLRWIASLQSFLSPTLVKIVTELEMRAEQLESAAPNDDALAAPVRAARA
jgi:hypothetical protein